MQYSHTECIYHFVGVPGRREQQLPRHSSPWPGEQRLHASWHLHIGAPENRRPTKFPFRPHRGQHSDSFSRRALASILESGLAVRCFLANGWRIRCHGELAGDVTYCWSWRNWKLFNYPHPSHRRIRKGQVLHASEQRASHSIPYVRPDLVGEHDPVLH